MRSQFVWLAVLPLLLSACDSLPSWLGGTLTEKPKLEGVRSAALPATGALVPDEALKTSAPAFPAAIENSDWAQHSGVFTAATANLAMVSLDKKNSTSIGKGDDFSHTLIARPVVAAGVVFAMDGAGHISAHKAGDIGNRLWRAKGVADEDDNDIFGGGLAVDSNVLYVTSGQGVVAALDVANGNEIWRKNLGVTLRSAPRVADNMLVVVTIDNQAYGLVAKTGEIVWNHRGINETAAIMNSVSPTLAGGAVFVPYSSGEIFTLLAADGKEVWSDTLIAAKHTQAMSSFSGIGGDPVVDGEALFATGSNGVTAAIHIPTGRRIWQQQAASINTPWLVGDELFVFTSDNVLVDMVKYTGKIRWATQLESYKDPEVRLHPINWRGPVLAGGNLLMVGSHGKMAVISADGKTISFKDIPKDIYTAPVIASSRMYLVGKDATLYEFQ